MNKINDTESYIQRLDKSMTTDEKLFFVGKVNLCVYDYIIDFGCANGELLHQIADITNAKLIGIDNYFDSVIDNRIELYKDVKKVSEIVKDKKYLVICSSVLHELPYVGQHLHSLLWGAKTIIVRDMYFDTDLKDEPHRKEIEGIKDKLPECWQDYPTNTLSMAYELLLKYEYVQNYSHEVQEKYFCNNAYDEIDVFVRLGYKVVHLEKYILPYKQMTVERDFGIKLKYPTHIKAILMK